MRMIVRTPSPPLSCYVERLYFFEYESVAHSHERVLPSGRSQLIVDLTDAPIAPIVVGLHTRYTILDTAALRCLAGVVFQPGGARALIDVPADECRDEVIAVEAVWGRAASDLRDRLREAPTADEKLALLETALFERMIRHRFTLHGAVRHGLARFESAPHIASVMSVARETGVSRRRFAELFREQVGLTPKLYCRLLRFQRVVRQMASGRAIDWRDVALAGGFSDQPHLAHEFRDFSGISLTEYMNSSRMHANHVIVT